MSTEHLSNPNPAEAEISSHELEAARAEKLAELREAFSDQDPADHAERRAETAREVIGRQETHEAAPADTKADASPPRPVMSVLNHRLNYAQTLSSVQRRLSPVSRTFSRIIHVPAIETASEALEKTAARPSLLLGALWTAVAVGAVFYFTARYYGYLLSGSELLFSLAVGAGLGLIGEAVWRLLRRR